MKRRIAQVVALAGLLVIVATTLVPLPQQRAAAMATPLWCLVCGEYGGVDVLNNILLFLPLGLGLRLLGLPTGRVVMVGSLLSLGIELLQFTVIPGRDASLSDVLTNTLGSWIGATTVKHGAKVVLPRPTEAAALALSMASVWLAVLAATAVLLHPGGPSDIRGGAWARIIPGRTAFDGRVTSAVVSGRPVANQVKPIPGLASTLRHGDVELEVNLLSGSHAADWSPVFEVLGRLGSVLSLEAVGSDLAFHPPLRSSLLRLRRPALLLDDALPSQRGLPVRVSGRLRGDTLSATWSIAEGRVLESLQVFSPSMGWSLITPFRYAFGTETRWITGAWIGIWLAIIAYWAAATRSAALGVISGLGLLLVTGLALIPRLFGYPASHWSEWTAGVAGAGIGWASQHFATYLGQRCGSLFTRESF